MFNFEKLETWQKAINFADLVYELTRNFPAAVSISSNIAEGAARNSKHDYARFLEIATGSLFEVVSQSFIGRRQGFLAEPNFQQLYAAAEEQGKMLSGLRRSVLEGS